MAKKKVAEELGGDLLELGSEEAWLKHRLATMTGTDAAVIARTSRYESRHGLWLKKTGRLVEDRTVSNNAEERYGPAYWGIKLEPDLRETFAEDKGFKVVQDPEWAVRLHPEKKWMSGSLDGHVYDPDHGWGVFEAKTAGLFLEDAWKDGKVPKSYLVQVMHYMGVTGYQFAWFAVLIGGQKYRTFFIERVDSFVDMLMDAEEAFFKNVTEDVPVEIDGHPEEANVLSTMFPIDDGETVDLPAVALEWDQERTLAIKTLEEGRDARASAENNIKACIGDSSYGILPDGAGRYSWKGKPRRLLRQGSK